LTAHPSPLKFKDIPFATGSLGHGFPIGAGIAKAKKLKRDDSKVFVLMSDGETNEGTIWEAAHFSVKHKLDNLIVIIDKNKIQGFGKTKDVLGDTANKKKFDSIGIETFEIDGHNIGDINKTIQICKKSKIKSPKIIIADTIKGKGVSYMENNVDWHYWPMNEINYKDAILEIKEKYIA
jgi:transketolase